MERIGGYRNQWNRKYVKTLCADKTTKCKFL